MQGCFGFIILVIIFASFMSGGGHYGILAIAVMVLLMRLLSWFK